MRTVIGNSNAFSIRRRNLLLVAVAILVLFLIAVGANGIRIGDMGVSFWAVFGILLGIAFTYQLRQEQVILANPTEASATVLRLWHAGHRRGFHIKYEFIAGDGKRYIGNATAPYPLPTEGQAVEVVYRRDHPTRSLPRRQFFFHELHGHS